MRAMRIALIALLVVACERERFEPNPAIPVRTEVARRTTFTPALTLLGVTGTVYTQPSSFMARAACQTLVMCRILSPSNCIM